MDLRLEVYGWMCDGLSYRACRERLIERGLKASDVPNLNSFTATKERDPDYLAYHAARLDWNGKMEKRRWAAKIQNDGRGPQTVADMAEMAILEQLYGLAEDGLLETGKDVATVARAITSLQRTQLARAEAAKSDAIARIESAHAEALAAKAAEIATLRQQLAEARNDGKAVDAAAVADKMNEVLGVRKA
jgi:transposase-like protein